jgi:hypothetical protein
MIMTLMIGVSGNTSRLATTKRCLNVKGKQIMLIEEVDSIYKYVYDFHPLSHEDNFPGQRACF